MATRSGHDSEASRDERNRRGHIQTWNNTIGWFDAVVLPLKAGGYREARIFDREFLGWLCPHTHPTEREAAQCRKERDPLFNGPRSDGPWGMEMAGEAAKHWCGGLCPIPSQRPKGRKRG